MKNRSLIDITKDLVLAQNDYEIFQEEDLMKKVDEHITELYTKEDGTYFFYKQIESQISLGAQQLDKIKRYVKVLKNMQERIKQSVIGAFITANQLPAHSDFNPINISQSAGAVDIIDEEKIPSEYWVEVVSKKLDKRRILEELKNGDIVPGCRIVRKDYVKGLK
jgi:hypothetical protein